MEATAGRVSTETKQYLDGEAERLDTTVSDVVGRILDEYATEGRRLDEENKLQPSVQTLHRQVMALTMVQEMLVRSSDVVEISPSMAYEEIVPELEEAAEARRRHNNPFGRRR